MSKRMGRPKVLPEDMVRAETEIPWDEDAALNAVAEESGVSKRALLRLFISSGLSAYTDAWAAVNRPPATPTARRQS